MSTVFVVAALCFCVPAWVFLKGTPARLRSRAWVGGGLTGLFGLLCLVLALLAGMIALAIRGYHAFAEEDLAATVRTEPVGGQRFRATIMLPDRRFGIYELAGDAFYVDAHILKWHRLVTLLGLPTAYQLDRVAGRYNDVADERTKPHTVYALARPKLLDLYFVARRGLLGPLVDAQYGSGTFAAASGPSTFEVRVSTTGLLLRRVASSPLTP